MKEKSLQILELPAVLEQLAGYAVSDGAKALARALRPLPHMDDMRRSMEETEAALKLMNQKPAPGLSGLSDVTDAVHRADRGGILHAPDLLRIAAFLRCVRDAKRYFSDDRKDDAPKTPLDIYFQMLNANKFLEEKISACILSEDEVADSASSELASIRRQMRAANARVREVLHKIISSPSYAKVLQESLITMRGDRYVVPVRAEMKGSINGLVHDVSASGQTVYVEPMQVVEANNELRLLAAREAKEIERILAELSAEVGSFSGAICDDFRTMTALDFIFARARYALKLDALPPKIEDNASIFLRRARHPLLPVRSAVPIDIAVGGDYDTLIITGPNTGGKTVALKTIGLLTVMAQCGLHIPAEEDSRVSVFSQVFADIGDEQSISQSLSTFSSHMVNIVDILGELDDRSLVLFDELGAGTDPVEGAALAMSIIEHLRQRGARIVATTHYAELKTYALTADGVENAACEFDIQTLKPTYRLLTGVPGKSNAFAISARLGLPEEIISAAKSSLKQSDVQFEDVLNRLEQERQAMERERDAVHALRREAEESAKKAQESLIATRREHDDLMDKARAEAAALVSDAKAATDTAFEEIRAIRKRARENQNTENYNAARTDIQRLLNETLHTTGHAVPKRIVEHARPLQVGDTVELLASGNRATVLSLPDKNGKIKLQAGIIQLTLHESDVQLILDGEKPKEKKQQGSSIQLDVQSHSATASTTLDLRGMNSDEGLIELQRFLDGASMANLQTVTIIHGKGTGILRAAVQDALKKDRRVKSYRLGRYGEGEAGVTIAELK